MTFERRSRGNANSNKRDGPPVSKPKPEDFNPGKVAMDVRTDALNHPVTIYPLIGSIGATVCALAFPATLPLAAGIATVGLITSGASWYYNYVLKGEEKVAERYRALREQRRLFEEQELQQLKLFCQKANFLEGVAEAEKLNAAYEPLLEYFQEKLAKKSIATVEQFQILAADTYKQGVSVLEKALDVSKALSALDVDALEAEVKSWKKELSKAKEGSTKAKTLEQQIASNTRRIDLYNQRQDMQLELIAQVNEIECALQTTYLELVDLGNRDLSNFLSGDGGASTRLRSAVDAARRVEKKLRGSDPEDEAKRNKYRKAADQV